MISYKTYLPTLALICMISILPQSAFTQEDINTKSGQLLTVQADGTYSYRATEANDSSEDDFMGMELNALEDPNDTDFGGDRQEKMVLRKLKMQLQTIEAKSTVDRYNHKVTIKQIKKRLKAAKKAKLEGEVSQLQAQLDAVDVQYDLADMRAEESYSLIKKVKDLKKIEPAKRSSSINEIVKIAQEKLGTDVETIKSTKVDYSFEVDDENPEHITHGEECNITYNGRDSELNKDRVEHAPQYLFGYTSEKLKHFLKNDNFLKCNAYLTKLDDDYYLNLDLDLATKDASRNYGFIDKGDMIKLTFINGDNFVANSIYRAEGKLEPYSGHTKYEAVYKLQDIEMELIEDLELDKLAIIWSSGFEEYPVYEIDILQRQLECLKKAK